jgi:hypothetical protein
MESFLSLLAPVVVSGLTQVSKYIVPALLKISNKWLVLIVAVLSYIVALANSVITGQPVDPVSLQTFADMLVNLLGATGLYFFTKK